MRGEVLLVGFRCLVRNSGSHFEGYGCIGARRCGLVHCLLEGYLPYYGSFGFQVCSY